MENGQTRRLTEKKSGSVLVLVLLVVLVSFIIGTGLLALGTQSRVASINQVQDMMARSAADAGLERAVQEINNAVRAKTWPDGITSYASNVALPYSSSTYSVKTDYDAATEQYHIMSVGTDRKRTRTINATLQLKGLFEYAILLKETMILKAGTVVDGYHSQDPSMTDVGLQIATVSTAPDRVILNMGTTVDGEVLVGVGGDADSVIKDLGATTSDRRSLVAEPPFPQIIPPILAPMDAGIFVEGTTATITPADSGKYTSITIKQISETIKTVTTNYPGTLEISGGEVVLHVTGDIWLGQGCEILVRDGASLILYVDGDIVCGNGGGIGYDGIPEDPSHVQLYGTGSGEQSFDLKAKDKWSGVVYAPNADITLYAKGDAYGSFVANALEFKADGNLFYDGALSEVSVDDVGARFAVNRWREQ
ncbi:MAG: collagen-binding domain-containing protein [Planctomycetota bacterium]